MNMIRKALLCLFGLVASASDESCALQVNAAKDKEETEDGQKPKRINVTRIFEADVTPDVIFGGGNAQGSFAITRIDFKESQLRFRARLQKVMSTSTSLTDLESSEDADGPYPRRMRRRGRVPQRQPFSRVAKILDRLKTRAEKYNNQTDQCVELALRAKTRFFPDVNNPANRFFANGKNYGPFGIHQSQDCNCEFSFGVGACWNYEWSVNTNYCGTGDLVLEDLTYLLCIYRTETSEADRFCYDPVNLPDPAFNNYHGDNTFGNGGTPQPANRSQFEEFLSTFNVAQNSFNTRFLASFSNANDNVTDPGLYVLSLTAFKTVDMDHNVSTPVLVGSTKILVNQSTEASCSDPITIAQID